MRNMRKLPRRAMLTGAAGAAMAGLSGAGRAAPSGQPVRIGSTLSLTGPLAQTAMVHKIAGEISVELLNQKDGLLGRPVEWVLLDDQSKPDVTRSLYEKLITVDKVDLIFGPYGTNSILASLGVAQRSRKLFIQSTLGIPRLMTYELAFPATQFGPEPNKSYPNVVFDAMAATKTPPKSVAILTSKFPSAQFMAEGTRDVAKERGLTVATYLEYEFGTRDFGAIAARVKDINADFLWVGSLGLESNQLLEALKKLDYVPPRHFHLYPAPGPLAVSPDGKNALSSTFFEPAPPFLERPGVAEMARLFTERATKANLPYTLIDAQAAGRFVQWQMLQAAVAATKSLDDATLGKWLKASQVDTIYGKLRFDGPYNHGPAAQFVKQVQDGKWHVVWPGAVAAPGIKLLAP